MHIHYIQLPEHTLLLSVLQTILLFSLSHSTHALSVACKNVINAFDFQYIVYLVSVISEFYISTSCFLCYLNLNGKT